MFIFHIQILLTHRCMSPESLLKNIEIPPGVKFTPNNGDFFSRTIKRNTMKHTLLQRSRQEVHHGPWFMGDMLPIRALTSFENICAHFLLIQMIVKGFHLNQSKLSIRFFSPTYGFDRSYCNECSICSIYHSIVVYAVYSQFWDWWTQTLIKDSLRSDDQYEGL